MGLAFEVRRFVDRVRKQPSDGSNPSLLARLDKAAEEAIEGIVALTAPASPMTWEVNALVLGATQTTNRVAFKFPRPVEVVGFYPSLVLLGTGAGPTTPSLDSLSVSIDVDTQNYLTSGEGVSTIAGTQAGPYVTLAAMAIQTPRVVGYKLRNPTPVMGFTYRWKRDVSGGAVFKDVLVSMALYARYL